jgi:signal transduction histidine kinase
VPRAWIPIVFVAVALLLLLITPVLVSQRVRLLRERTIDVADQARTLVSEFEASFAAELVAWAHETGPAADSNRQRAIAVQRAAELSLDSIVPSLGVEATERLVELRTAEGRWRELNANDEIRGGAPPGNTRAADGREVIAAAESLHSYLVDVSTRSRDRARQLQGYNVIATVALTPVALIALAIVLRLQRRMLAFATEADDRAAKLARSAELRAALVHGVVHDIKNPLGAASGYADLLSEGFAGAMNDQQTEMVQRMKRLVGTAQGTASELVELARVDAGEFPIDRRESNIVGTVRDIVDDHRARATQKSILLTFETPTDTIRAVTDPLRVRHIVENLLSNAIKYTPERGVVRVSLTIDESVATKRTVRIDVADTGPGVPAEYRDRIFEAFFRLPSTETTVPGTGLGLAISRRIARLLGGDVTVDAVNGHGSVFTLVLPLDQSDAVNQRQLADRQRQ